MARVVVADYVIGELLQRLELVVRGEDLEVAEPHERRRDAAHDRTRLGSRVAVVEHIADHFLAGADEGERARGRYAKMEHRFAAREFAQRRAQHGAAVGGA